MKRIKYSILVIIGLLMISVTGCKDQVLNKKPTQSFTEQDIWNDIDLVKKFVWNNYNALGGWGINASGGLDLPASVTDNAYILFDYGAWATNTGNLSPDNMGTWGNRWQDDYSYIRNTNIFFNRIDEVEGNDAVKKRLKGEMKFIRAWCYADLVNLFGGVPVIEKPFELNDDFKVKRKSYQESVNWIVKELDAAKDMVPKTVSSNEWGRVTKGAVLALKSRVLLIAASKLHDPGTEPSGSLYDYDKSSKWQDASDAAKAVIDLNQYSLVDVTNWKEYQQMFLHNNSEIIFAKPHHPQYRQRYSNIDNVNTPNGYHGWSGNCPIQNLVDDFQMKDGKSIDESPMYNPSPDSVYENREMRFYADIVYQGATYRGRKTEFYLPGGQDSQDGPEYWNYARTGYTMRKHMDESIDFKQVNPTTPKIFFRLAEIYLNYAEAQFHLGNEGVAREYVNKIRNRVKLPDISSSGADLLNDIRHERRIELCFEGYHRFNDLRRWMIAEDRLNIDAKGIAWKKVDDQGKLSLNGDLTYEFITAQERNFKKRMYYLPIPRSEIEKTDLKQNWGYK